jgi:Ca2+-binding RTX toxin-like protein
VGYGFHVIKVKASDEEDDETTEIWFQIGTASGETLNNIGLDYPVIVYGLGGDDIIYGSDYHGDTLVGGDGNDQLYGYDGDDILVGGNGNDELYGGGGDDILIGGAGDDFLIGGAGDDTMDGGYGRDTFVFDFNGEATIGTDTINNFNVQDDLILISGLQIDSFEDLEDLIDPTQTNDTVINFVNGDSITLVGVNPHSLTAANFDFEPGGPGGLTIGGSV